MSHPTMGAWIEILKEIFIYMQLSCRTPRWVRGLKLIVKQQSDAESGVAPHDGCVD